jgi:hypothetical protein
LRELVERYRDTVCIKKRSYEAVKDITEKYFSNAEDAELLEVA